LKNQSGIISGLFPEIVFQRFINDGYE